MSDFRDNLLFKPLYFQGFRRGCFLRAEVSSLLYLATTRMLVSTNHLLLISMTLLLKTVIFIRRSLILFHNL
ncbi:MAG: hypothetical protein CMN93_07840 [Synechococcus sp. CPC35]|nr:hypothetical protein [Synechococcus sp. CPC35]